MTTPKVSNVYTLAEIVELDLRDSPCLMFDYEGERCSIQDSHFDYTPVWKSAPWADIRFKYIRETHEWIPIFRVVEEDLEKLIALLDIEPSTCNFSDDAYWVVPKAYPRSQDD